VRLALLLTFFVLAQTGSTAHLRYERSVDLPALPTGEPTIACVILDATTFAHAANRSGNDLRLYRASRDSAADQSGEQETPFTLLESEAPPEDVASAIVQNRSVRGDTLSFDLKMPQQFYTAVDLRLAAKNFLGVATVSNGPTQLGTFTLFDLTRKHLARSTALALQEQHLPMLHVELRFWDLDGKPIAHPSPTIVEGADVPPSRQAQTLYTTVAAVAPMPAKTGSLLATLMVPAHVPVERVRVTLDPGHRADLFRPILIDAMPQAANRSAVESLQGSIAMVNLPAPSGSAPAVHYESLTVEATLGANLREPALVRIAIPNWANPPAIRVIELQMRQRSLCFDAVADSRYTLRYGDAGLAAPVYDDMAGDAAGIAHATVLTGKSVLAVLGREHENPAFIARPRSAAVGETHPEMFWVGLLSMVTLSATVAAHRVRQDKRRS
jgi:hypothetical protein